ncbi:MAG: DUF47 domain-containing protein [Terriglobales bacterium]
MKWTNARKTNFHESLKALASVTLEATRVLEYALSHMWDTATVAERFSDLKCRGDEICHDIHHFLHRVLITSFDHEDILQVASSLHELLDRILAAGQILITHPIAASPCGACELASILALQCKALRKAVRSLKAHEGAVDDCEEVRQLKRRAENVSHAAVASLFESEMGAIEIIQLRALYEALERAIETASEAADAIGNILFKNV